MGIFRKVGGRLIDTRVDQWMSWAYLGETATRFKILLVDIITPQKATYTETFDEAMQRLELTEDDVVQRKKEFVRLVIFFCLLAVAIIIYALYFAFAGKITPALISFCISVYCLAQAFRFHFWLFQLKHRKLGCTFKEWWNSKVSEEPQYSIVEKSSSTMPSAEKRRENEE